jgi:hypothetical protein
MKATNSDGDERKYGMRERETSEANVLFLLPFHRFAVSLFNR